MVNVRHTHFSKQQRVRGIVLTGRNSILFIKRFPDPAEEKETVPYWIAPGGNVLEGEDDEMALRRELAAQMGVEVRMKGLALTLFMGRWNFYLCRLIFVDRSLRTPEYDAALRRGAYRVEEVLLEEQALRTINIQPRALFDYLLRNYEALRKPLKSDE